VFLLTRCTPFRNIYQAPVNEHCRCDILFSNPVAVTGDVYDGHVEMTEVPFACLEALPFFKHKPRVIGDGRFDFDAEWWSQPEEPLPDRFDFLRNHMEHWNGGRVAAKHNGRSNATFSAACHLLRSGVVGWQALRLLELFQTDPPFDEAELQHKLEGAYHAVAHQRATEPLTEFD
jgi:hypothetical protein